MARFRTEVTETASVGAKTTVGRLLDEWLENLDPALAQNTVEVYRKRVDNQIRLALGTVRLDQLDHPHDRHLLHEADGRRALASERATRPTASYGRPSSRASTGTGYQRTERAGRGGRRS